jgi:hypothetical protein
MKKYSIYIIFALIKVLICFPLLSIPKSDAKKEVLELYRTLKKESRRWKKYLEKEDVDLLEQRTTDLKRYEIVEKQNELTLEAILDDIESLLEKVPEDVRAKKVQRLIDNLR